MAQVFVDMDGVLADFDRGYFERFGLPCSKEADNVDWSLVDKAEWFYRDLPPMPDFEELWAGVAPYNPIILTGLPKRSMGLSLENKKAWVTKHIGPDQLVVGCLSKDKALYGAPGDVLIDDWDKYRDRWHAMGGVFILHTAAALTLPALRFWAGCQHDHGGIVVRSYFNGTCHERYRCADCRQLLPLPRA